MKREIKFRAYDTITEYMFVQGTPDLETIQSFFFHIPKNAHLMQSTGLLDKNEKEIYEGDYLKQEGLYVEVKWGVFEAGFIFEDGSGSLMTVTSGNSNMWEVIGNVYEGLYSGEKTDIIGEWKNNTDNQSQKHLKDIKLVKKPEEK